MRVCPCCAHDVSRSHPILACWGKLLEALAECCPCRSTAELVGFRCAWPPALGASPGANCSNWIIPCTAGPNCLRTCLTKIMVQMARFPVDFCHHLVENPWQVTEAGHTLVTLVSWNFKRIRKECFLRRV